MSRSPLTCAALTALVLTALGFAQDAHPAPGAPTPAERAAPASTADLAEARRLSTRARTALRDGRAADARADVMRAAELALAASELDAQALKLLEEIGELAFDLHQPLVERDVWRRVVGEFEKSLDPDDARVQRARSFLAEALSVLGELGAAEALQRRVLAGFERRPPADTNEWQVARMNLAATLGRGQDLAGARVLIEQVLEVWQRTLPPDAPELLQARQYLLNVLNGLGDAAQACAAAGELLEAAQRALPPEHETLASVRVAVAQARERCGDVEGATQALVDAIAALEPTHAADDAMLLLARRDLGIVRLQAGKLHEAAPLLEAVLQAHERTRSAEDPVVLAARADLAQVRLGLGDLSGARALLDPSLATLERGALGEEPTLAPLQVIASQLRLREGDVVAARRLAERALSILQRICAPDHPDVTGAQLTLASALNEMGDLPGACAMQRAVLASRERTLPDDAPRVSHARAELAITLARQGDWSAALELQRRVVDTHERTLPPESLELASARLNLATTLRNSGELDAAHELLEEIARLCDAGLADEHPLSIETRRTLAQSCLERGELERARSLVERALAALVRRFPEEHPDVQRARRTRCWILAAGRESAELRAELERVASGLARRLAGALALAPRETLEAASSARPDVDLLLSLGPRVERPEALARRAFELAERLRAVSSAPWLPAGASARDPELAALVEEVRAARRALESESGGVADGGKAATTLLERVRARDALEARLRQHAEQRGLPTLEFDLERIRAALAPQAAVVAYLRHADLDQERTPRGFAARVSDHLCAHVVRARAASKDGAGEVAGLVRIDLGPIEPIAAAVERWRAEIGRPLHGAATTIPEQRAFEAGVELRRRVVDPVLGALGDVTMVHVCLDDVLHLVPLDALPLAAGAGESAPPALIGERWRIVEEVNLARMLAPAPPLAKSRTLLALGGVDFDAPLEAGAELPFAASEAPEPLLALAKDPRSALEPDAAARGIGAVATLRPKWPSLPETAIEVKEIGELFERAFGSKASLSQGAQATKRALYEQSRSARFLHVATHGYTVDGPLASTAAKEDAAGLAPLTLCGLALAGANGPSARGRRDGVLSAEELSGFDLTQCELAVLSACETASGVRRAGQGVQSLRAALHAAGARSAITSLWTVGDAATRALFTDFYTRIWIGVEPLSQALWNAKLALRARGAPPSDWAGWILSGARE